MVRQKEGSILNLQKRTELITMVTEIVVDTSALIEYTFVTEKGKMAKEIIENPENIILTLSIVIGEFISKLERSGVKNVKELLHNLASYLITLPIDSETCFNAGKKHAELRKNEKEISVVDCIIMQVAEEHGNAIVLTVDNHFKHYKNSKIL